MIKINFKLSLSNHRDHNFYKINIYFLMYIYRINKELNFNNLCIIYCVYYLYTM